MSAPPDHHALLGDLAEEMARARQEVQRVEALVARLACHAPAAERARTVVEAQGLDALSQTLDALATVLARLGQGVPPKEAIMNLPLADLAARLGDGTAEPRPTRATGELQLF